MNEDILVAFIGGALIASGFWVRAKADSDYMSALHRGLSGDAADFADRERNAGKLKGNVALTLGAITLAALV